MSDSEALLRQRSEALGVSADRTSKRHPLTRQGDRTFLEALPEMNRLN